MNRRGFLFGCERLCALAVVLFALLVALPAHAWIHGVPASGACPYGIDNGCSGSTAYVAVPFYRDTNFAFNHATSGQLPPSPTGAQITAYNAALHSGGANEPLMDYAVGSADPATLALPTSFSTAACSYSSTGAVKSGGPVLTCQPTLATNGATITIPGYNFTDGAGNCVEVDIKPNGTNTWAFAKIVFINDYFKVQGVCFSAQGNALVYAASGSNSSDALEVDFINITAEGNFANAPNAGQGSIGFFQDNRTCATGVGCSYVANMTYSLVQNLGHDPITGFNNGSSTIAYSALINNCLGGPTNCHGEPIEYTSNNTAFFGQPAAQRATYYTGVVETVDGTYMTPSQTTTMFYGSSGATSGIDFSIFSVTNSVAILNYVGCTTVAGPYGPNNPCTPAQGGIAESEGFIALDYGPHLHNLQIANNVFDGTGSANGYTAGWTGFVITAQSAGPTVTVTQPQGAPAAYSNPTAQNGHPVGLIWPGTMIHDSSGVGFVDAMVSSFGTYTNTGPTATPCVIGTNAGCGTLNMPISNPTVASGMTLTTYAGIDAVSWSNNRSVGGAYGATVKAMNFTPFGSVNLGKVPLP